MYGKKEYTDCPIRSVRITPQKNRYQPFSVLDSITNRELEEFEAYIGDPSGHMWDFDVPVAALIYKYSVSVTEKVFSGSLSKDEAVKKLLFVIEAYGKEQPMLCRLAGEWICDLLILQGDAGGIYDLVGTPMREIRLVAEFAVGRFISAILQRDSDISDEEILRAIFYLCQYDCTASLCYEKDSVMYRKIMAAVIPAVFEHIHREKGTGFFVPRHQKMKRDAFCTLACSCGCAAVIELEYIPYSQNPELSELLGATVKHTENLIRQGLGIKTRVVGSVISTEYKKLISDTIRSTFPGFLPAPVKVGRKPKHDIKRKPGAAEQADTFKYEPIDLNIDFTKAKKLESESWKLAALFGTDYGGESLELNIENEQKRTEYDAVPKEAESISFPTTTVQDTSFPEPWGDFIGVLSDDEKKFLCCMANGADVVSFAKKRGGMCEGYTDSINEKASDTCGDIVIESTDGIPHFIEDYEKELTKIFSDMYTQEVL